MSPPRAFRTSNHREVTEAQQFISAFRAAGNSLGRSRDFHNEVDDAGLLQRSRHGDVEAFSQLFTRYKTSIYRYAAHMCDPDAADDIVQETFLTVLRQTRRDDPPHSSVGGYLFGVARH